jgi:DNA (cytosine-5)-methyltransferase 1
MNKSNAGMGSLKVLNLYAGIGGNRKLWTGCEVTAVEIDPEIASIYQEFYPHDKVVIGDAHQYLLDNYQEFDFIWSSPPCQTHSQIRYNIGFKANRKYRKVDAVYPDMSLYQEIILLDKFYAGQWVVENTIPYYEPLIAGQRAGGHIFWSNFLIGQFDIGNRNHRGGTVETLSNRKLVNLDKFDIKNKRQILRNCVEPELGLFIYNSALNPIKQGHLL